MKHKSLIALLFCIVSLLSGAARPEREIVMGRKNVLTLKPGNYEIVISTKATPVVKWTANEMAGLLKEMFGVAPAVVTAPTGKIPINLGMELCNLDEATTAKLKEVRDSYHIAVTPKGIYIGGWDDEKKSPQIALNKEGIWGNLYARSTMMGCYDFLDRFMGVRFYFVGRLGTIIPKRQECSLQECRIFERPDFISRQQSSFYDGEYFEGEGRKRTIHPQKKLQMYRNRLETQDVPFCHGTNFFNYLWRFKDTHPEYFALRSNGKRHCDPNLSHPGQLCFSSGITEEMYQDVKAALTGQPATSRGMVDKNGKPQANWGYNFRWNKYVDIMPQDGYNECFCEKCQAAYDKSNSGGYATELIWRNVANIGNRLKQENIPGELTMMAYWPYRTLPKTVKIPDNVNIMFATASGPFRGGHLDPAERVEIMKWINATHKKVWFWSYVCKSGVLKDLTVGVPNPCPRGVARFYREVAPLINGGYMENDGDRYLFQALNNYVFSKICWDNNWDADAGLKEYYSLMFGKAAPDMTAIMDDFEDVWVQKVTSRVAYTAIGPVNSPPTAYELWTKIYNSEKLASIKANFDKAASKVPADSLEGERIALFRREYLDQLTKAHDEYVEKLSAISHFKVRISDKMEEPVFLKPFNYKSGELVSTVVNFAYEGDALHFSYVCEEPYIDKVSAPKREQESIDLYKDNSVELFINPSGDRKVAYQFIVNCEGNLADLKSEAVGAKTQKDISWNSGARCAVTKGTKFWSADIYVPLDKLPGLNRERAAFNFCRNRYIDGKNIHILYTWSPFVHGFHDFENFGVLSYNLRQLAYNGDFAYNNTKSDPRHYGYYYGKDKDRRFRGWVCNPNHAKYFSLDKETYVTAPASMRVINQVPADGTAVDKNVMIRNTIHDMKPSTKYRMTFLVKVKDVVPLSKGGGFVANVWDSANSWYPRPALTGTLDDWIVQSFEFTTRPDTGKKGGTSIGFHMLNATGTAWVDHVMLEEIE